MSPSVTGVSVPIVHSSAAPTRRRLPENREEKAGGRARVEGASGRIRSNPERLRSTFGEDPDELLVEKV